MARVGEEADVGAETGGRVASGAVRCALAVAVVLLLAAPARGEDDPRAQRFAAGVARVLARKELAGTSVGLHVRSLDRGTVLMAHGADTPLAPASNMKLVTLCLALATLGPGFEFETPLLADAPIVEGGRIDGSLWVRGSGDPTLQPCFFGSAADGAALEPFVQALVLQGVRRVTGDLIVDARAFDEEWIPAGWPRDQLLADYCAPVAALSLNGNLLRVRVGARSGGSFAAELLPPVAGWSAQADLSWSAQRDAFLVSLLPPDRRGVVRVRGSIGADVGAGFARVTVEEPPLYFGGALHAALAAAGVRVEGRVRPPAAGEQPGERARTLYTRRSPLFPALVLCGKESDNHVAEMLLKSCALARFGRGTLDHGARLVEELARAVGVDPAPLHVADGSGLSRDDRLTAELLTAVLAHAYAAGWRDEYVRCLPISGVDGTLERRLAEPALQYRVRAKTGYIARVSGLSGYLFAGDPEQGEAFAFSFLMNGFSGSNAEMKKAQDDLCRALFAAVAR